MTQEKQKKLIVSVTVGAIILLLVLVAMLTVILVKKSNMQKDIQILESKCDELQQLIDENAEIGKIMETKAWIEQYAREHGYYYDGDIVIGGTTIEIPDFSE